MIKANTKDGFPKQKKRYNVQVIKSIAAKRSLDEDFIRQCIRGDRNSETAQQIREEYKTMSLKLTEILQG